MISPPLSSLLFSRSYRIPAVLKMAQIGAAASGAMKSAGHTPRPSALKAQGRRSLVHLPSWSAGGAWCLLGKTHRSRPAPPAGATLELAAPPALRVRHPHPTEHPNKPNKSPTRRVSVNDPIGCSANARRGFRWEGTERDGGGKLSARTAVASKINAICPIRRPTWTNDEGKKKSSEMGNTAALGVWLLSRDSEDGPDILDVFAFAQMRTETFFLTTGFYQLTRPNGRRLCLTDA